MFKSFSLKSLIFYKRFCSNKHLTDTIFALSSGLNSAISVKSSFKIDFKSIRSKCKAGIKINKLGKSTVLLSL